MAVGRRTSSLIVIAVVSAVFLTARQLSDTGGSHATKGREVHLQGQKSSSVALTQRRLELPGGADEGKLNDRLLELQRAIQAVLGVDEVDEEVQSLGLLITVVDGPAAQILLPLLLDSLRRLPSRPDRKLLAVALDAEALEACQLHHSACLRRTLNTRKQERRQRVVRVGVSQGNNDGDAGKIGRARDGGEDEDEGQDELVGAQRHLLQRKNTKNPYGNRYQMNRNEGRGLDAVPSRDAADSGEGSAEAEASDARGHSLTRVNEGRKKARRKAKAARRARQDAQKRSRAAALQGGGSGSHAEQPQQQGSEREPSAKQKPGLERVKMPADAVGDRTKGIANADTGGQSSKAFGKRSRSTGGDSAGLEVNAALLSHASEDPFRGGKGNKASKAAGVDSSSVAEHLEEDGEPELLLEISDELAGSRPQQRGKTSKRRGKASAAGVDSGALQDHFAADPEVLTEESSPERASAGISKDKLQSSKAKAKKVEGKDWDASTKTKGRSAGVDSQGVLEQLEESSTGGAKPKGKGRAAGVDSEGMREHAEEGDSGLQEAGVSESQGKARAAGADSEGLHEQLSEEDSELQAADADAVLESDGQEALSDGERIRPQDIAIAEAAAEEMEDLRQHHAGHTGHKDATERDPVILPKSIAAVLDDSHEEDLKSPEEGEDKEGQVEEEQEEEQEEEMVEEPETDGGLMSKVARGDKKRAGFHSSLWDSEDVVADANQDVQTEGVYHVRRRLLQVMKVTEEGMKAEAEPDTKGKAEQASLDKDTSGPRRRRQRRRKRRETTAAKAAALDWERVNLMRDVATLGFEALYTEPDVVWLQDPFYSLLLDAPAADGADVAVVAQGAAASIISQNRANISLAAVLIRPTPVAKVLLGEWHRRQSKPGPKLLLEFQRAWDTIQNRHPELQVQSLKESRYVSGCAMTGGWGSEVSVDPSKVPVVERKDWVLWHASCSGDFHQKQVYLQNLLGATKIGR